MADRLSYVICFLLGAHLVICCDKIRLNKSALCNPPHRNYTMSCYMQLPGRFKPEDCTIVFEKNTPRCLSKEILIEAVEQNTQNVQLKVYQFNDWHYVLPSFNVTMTNIKWNVLNLKYIIDKESVCIDFYINGHAAHFPSLWSMFFDCPWYSELIEGTYILLEYRATGNEYIEARRYSFITPATNKLDPCNKNVVAHETLTYLDLTYRPHLTLHIQKLPAHLQVRQYQVKQCFCTECSLRVHQSFENCVHVLYIKAGSEEHDELTVPINIAKESGNFFYVVYANSKMCENELCYVSRTETLTVKDLTGVVMGLFIGLLLLLCLLTISCLLWRKYCAKLLAAEADKMKHCTVLLLHHPLHSVHMRVVVYLAQFLEHHCNLDVLLDIRDIPQTMHKDPMNWYNSQISSVNCIAVISTPPCSDGQEAIYKDLHIVGLHFIKELMRSEISKTKIFTIMLPYCTETGIPVMAKHLQRIQLMQDIDSMISLIHDDTYSSCIRYSCIRQALLHKIHNSLETQGHKLKNAIAEMEYILKQNGEEGCLLKGPVYKEINNLMETGETLPTVEETMIERMEIENLNNGDNKIMCKRINYEELNISDIDLTGMGNSAELLPRMSHHCDHRDEICCDSLDL